VVSIIDTLCEPVYVPGPGLKIGVAACIAYALLATALGAKPDAVATAFTVSGPVNANGVLYNVDVLDVALGVLPSVE
jgi:hypothetical protein